MSARLTRAMKAAFLAVADYAAVRAYAGPEKTVEVIGYMATTKQAGYVGRFLRDDTDHATADNNATCLVDASGRRWKRVFDGPVNGGWFGMVDGADDNTTPFVALLTSGFKNIELPVGNFTINKNNLDGQGNPQNLVIPNLQNMTIKGAGPGTVISLYNKNLLLKAASRVTFRDMRFEGNPAMMDATQTPMSIWVSAFTDVTFDNCEFANFGGLNTFPDGTVALYLYAGPGTMDATTLAAPGNSEGGKVSNCRFFGNSRRTNFGVRVFTEWGAGASLAYANSGAVVESSTFGGFNWNAVEFAGPMTSNGRINDCTANVCGLTPFDFDKGANNCRGKNWTINRLLGNVDTGAFPNTRVACVSNQGETNVGRIALNNEVEGVTANLLAADIEAFGGNGGYCAVGFSNAKDCRVTKVQVNIDRVPVRNAAAGQTFAFAAICAESESGCTVEGCTVINGTHGFIETNKYNAVVGTDWNTYEFKNIGTAAGEAILMAKDTDGANPGGNYRRRVKCSFASDMTRGALDVVAINWQAKAAGAVLMVEGYVSTPGYTAINASGPNFAYRDLYIDFAANSNHINLFTVGSNCSKLYHGGLKFNGKPLDVSQAFQRLPATTHINSIKLEQVAGNLPDLVGGEVMMFATAQPANPTGANWGVPSICLNLTPGAGTVSQWWNYGGFWKTAGSLAP